MALSSTIEKLLALQAELIDLGADLAAQTVGDAVTFAQAYFDRADDATAHSTTTGYAPTITQEA